ncbi:MAG: hypothetical protein WCF18_10950 [Chthoniobacteraceae bacterium]
MPEPWVETPEIQVDAPESRSGTPGLRAAAPGTRAGLPEAAERAKWAIDTAGFAGVSSTPRPETKTEGDTPMGLSLDFIKDRAVKTISAATQIAATWTWQEKSIAEMQSALAAIIGDKDAKPPVTGLEETVSQSEQGMLAARGAWDGPLDTLHRWTVQGVGMARNRFRNDPAKLAQLAGLTADSNSRTETLAEALAWESAWASVDPAWAPMPANTLTAFKALRKQCNEELQTAYSERRAEWRRQSGKLAQLGRDLEDLNEAWYADATRAFPAGTPEGDMIRGTIPTTYTPPPPKPPTPPVPPAKP